MAITVKVSEWGNSLAIRLPKAVVDQLGLKAGGEAELELEAGAMTVKPKARSVEERHQAMIDEMRRLIAAGVEPPEIVDWGPDVGAEIIYDDWNPKPDGH